MGFWEWVYFVSVYISVLICLIAAFKIGRANGWRDGLLELLILVGFAVAYWLLESFAHHSAPFYVYPDVFPDMVPFFNLSAYINTPLHACNQHGFNEISLTVPFLEMSMTYCLMWTAKLLLRPHGWVSSPHATAVAPFIVGLMALELDATLDPIVSESFTCSPVTLNHPGIGFWKWFADPDMANFWYGIPMFNYGAWFAAPVILVISVLLINWIYELFLYLKGLFIGPPHPLPSVANGLFQIAILIAFLALHLTSPGTNPPYTQTGIMLVAIVVSLAIVFRKLGTYDRNNPFRWEFVVPLVIIFTMPLPMFFVSGTFNLGQDWLLALLAPLFAVIAIIFALSPYSGSWLFPSMAPQSLPKKPGGGTPAPGPGTGTGPTKPGTTP